MNVDSTKNFTLSVGQDLRRFWNASRANQTISRNFNRIFIPRFDSVASSPRIAHPRPTPPWHRIDAMMLNDRR